MMTDRERGNKKRLVRTALAVGLGMTASCAPGDDPETRVDLEGVWSGPFTSQEAQAWVLEDFACFAGCSPVAREAMAALLDDPANDEFPFVALQDQAWGVARQDFADRLTPAGLQLHASIGPEDDPDIQCEPFGYFRQALSPLPLVITQEPDRVTFAYEEWSAVRTVYLDGREHPANTPTTSLGHSVGRYEGSTLIVDTVGVSATILWPHMPGGAHSDQVHGVERYSRSDDGMWLQLELTIEDPVILREPWVAEKRWLATPDVTIVQDSCEDVAGQP